MKKYVPLFLATLFFTPLGAHAFPFASFGTGLPASISLTTATFTRLGVGADNSGAYTLEVYPTDINSVLISNASSNVGVFLKAQTQAYIAIDSNRNGGSNTDSQIKLLHNQSEIGHLEGDDVSNTIRIDAGSTEQSTTGINITSGHNVGIGTDVPAQKLDVTGSLLVSSNAVITGTGLSGTNPIFKVGGGTLTVLANGRVGINTTNPSKSFVNDGNDALFGNVATGDYVDIGSLGDTNGWMDAAGADTSVGLRFRIKGTASSYVFKNTTLDLLTINNGGSMVFVSSGITIPDDGAGTSPAYTLTPTSSHVEITCSDTNGCTITLGESNISQGQWVVILNVGANTATFADTSGVTETAGAFAAGQYDSITYDYMADRWIERCRSNN